MITSKVGCYLWYPRDFAADEAVVLMSPIAEFVYRRLLDHQWLHGSVPTDISQLAKICKGIPKALMRKAWSEVAGCFGDVEGEPNRKQNHRMERTRAADVAYREAQSQKGQRGGRPKAGAKPEQSQTEATALPNESPMKATAFLGVKPEKSPPSPSPSPSPSKEKESSPPAEHKLMAAFAPTDRVAVGGFLETTGAARRSWVARLSGYLAGLDMPPGLKATPTAIGTACRDYEGEPRAAAFRRFVERAMQDAANPITSRRAPVADDWDALIEKAKREEVARAG